MADVLVRESVSPRAGGCRRRGVSRLNSGGDDDIVAGDGVGISYVFVGNPFSETLTPILLIDRQARKIAAWAEFPADPGIGKRNKSSSDDFSRGCFGDESRAIVAEPKFRIQLVRVRFESRDKLEIATVRIGLEQPLQRLAVRRCHFPKLELGSRITIGTFHGPL